MSFYPSEYQLHQSAVAKETTTKVTDPSLSVEAEAKQSLATEHREVSGEYVQSFVIVNLLHTEYINIDLSKISGPKSEPHASGFFFVGAQEFNDIDVEEELSKAKKAANTNTTNANNNFFKVLSMSFYGKGKSHSLDHQEARDLHKTTNTTQGGHKPIAQRKISAHTPPESKRNTVKEKPKPQDAAKKGTLPVKNLQLVPEQFRKRLTSPKDESIKVYSPVVAGKNYQVGNFVSKNLPKKETTFSHENQSRPQTAKKRHSGAEGEEERGNATPDLKTTYTGRSSSPKGGEYKKQSSFNKLQRNKNRVLESIEEKTQTLDVEPSSLDIRPHDPEIMEEVVPKSTITPKGGSRIASKQSSREGSAKTMKDKPHYNPSVRSGGPAQMKFNLRDQIDAKAHFFDQESSKTNIGTGDKTPKTPSRDSSKKIDLTRDTTGSKKATPNTTASKNKTSKPTSQEVKKDTNSVEKLRYIGIVDLQDSDNDEQEVTRSGKNQVNKTMDRKQPTTTSYKADRQQKSPATVKLYERIPTALSTGIGNWGIEANSLAKDAVTPTKQPSKRGNGSPEVKGSATNSSTNLAIGKKPSTPGAQSGKEVQRVKKNNSEEKIAKVDLYDQWKGKKFEFGDNGRTVYTPKYEVNKPKDFSGKGKDSTTPTTTNDKTRPTSPIPVEGRKPLGLLDKLLAQKKSVREKL